jgi:hypothetical protein
VTRTDPDWIARALGVAGLVFGLVGVAVSVLTYRRDRPELEMGWHADPTVPELTVRTVNRGRQPIAVMGVKIAERRRPLWVRLWRLLTPFHWAIRLRRGDLIYTEVSIGPIEPLEEPKLLQPGEVYTCKFEAARILAFADATKLNVVASDVLGNEVRERVTRGLLDVLRLSTRGR